MGLAVIEDQTAFNIERWDELCADPELARLPHRIETDRFGKIVMSPPAGPDHGMHQSSIVWHMRALLPGGRVITECPISTSDGVKAADDAWISEARLAIARAGNVLSTAPEICVEVLSPSNTKGEIDHKKALYFEAGADEVWICAEDGSMSFYLKADPGSASRSALCPDFPERI